ncbi:hypothetical protein KSP39_PZI009123 [Platanthera zijinensis]|uniref:Retrovirus-related Pol polyprotein from transposon TNT 1-94-like beta-barrel domain-containing protein n=1 Tax=Platanthera zijinensis TaxID=2320716 RepID=A0AAP0G821_9ASPA
MDCKTAPEAWALLQCRLASVTKAHISSLPKQLRTLEKKPTASMSDYLMGDKRVADALAAAGEPISHFALVDYITDGLKEELQSFLSLIELRPPSSFDELFDMLINEEALLNRLRPKNHDSSALYAHSRPTGSSSSFSNPPGKNSRQPHGNNWRSGRGGNGGRWGNNSRGGYGNRRNSFQQNQRHHQQNQQSSLPPLLPIPASIHPNEACQICLKPGHTARTCYQRTNFAYSASLPDQMDALSLSEQNDTNWILDFGASHHMAKSEKSFLDMGTTSGNSGIVVGNGEILHVSCIGKVILPTFKGPLTLPNVLCVSSLSKNLFSVHQFAQDNNCVFLLDSNGFFVKDKSTGQTLLTGRNSKGLYHITPPPSFGHALLSSHASVSTWHARLGHPSQ